MDDMHHNEMIHGYEVKKSVVFENNRGFALAENPNAVTPFVTWQFTEDEHEARDYYWGHYIPDKNKAEVDFKARVAGYIKDYGVSERAARSAPEKMPIAEQLKNAAQEAERGDTPPEKKKSHNREDR